MLFADKAPAVRAIRECEATVSFVDRESGPPSIECPRCGSELLDFVRDPDTHAPLIGAPLLQCRLCREIFPASTEEFQGLSHKTIDFDLPCHKCGYNLRTLSAGQRCPECNAEVLESIWMSRLRPRRDVGRSNWIYLVIGVLMGLLLIGSRPYPQLRRVDLFLIVLSFFFGSRGLLAVYQREFEYGRWAKRRLRGGLAIAVGAAYFLVGVTLVVLALVYWGRRF